MIIDEGEKDGLTPANTRPVKTIAGPTLVRRVGLEPAEHPRQRPARAPGEFQTREVALQGPLIR